jgi:oxygen-independent coproporphyrinogen III oxidase
MGQQAISKYNQAIPRYTSYPTVPFWNSSEFSAEVARHRFVEAVKEEKHLFLYIHLPFCESLCTYCGCNKRITKNHGYERPYIEAVLKEWEMYRGLIPQDIIISGIHLGGGTPTFFSPENLRFLIEGLFVQAHLPAGEWYSFEGHPGNTTSAHLQTLFDMGFRRVSYGIQDMDETVQRAINRLQTKEEVQQATEMARKIGYASVNYDLIYGLPFQTSERLKHTIQETIELKPDRIAFYSYAHVPWVSKSQRAYSEKDLPIPDEKWALYQMGKEMLIAAGYRDVGMDHFALDGDSLFKAREGRELHRNFMGYTHSREKLLLGLGASSISDVGRAYWQNVKSLEGYQDHVLAGLWPVFKGHLHTESDLIRKSHILNLACHFETQVNESEFDDLELTALNSSIQTLIDEDIFIRAGSRLSFTPKGRDLLRMGCAAFDAYLPQEAEGIFSKAI